MLNYPLPLIFEVAPPPLLLIIFATESCGNGTTSLYYSGMFKVLNYSNGMRCNWHLHSRQGERVFITFTNFSTERGYDFVEIRDTLNTSSVLGRFSGSQIPLVVVSCGSSVSVTFVSDGMITSSGFTASFESRGKKDFAV